jgi:uncharacterized protein YlxW (UPF0749 family)
MKHNHSIRKKITGSQRMIWGRNLLFALLLILGFIISSEIRSIRNENVALEAIRRDYDFYIDLLAQETQREVQLEKRVSSLTAALYGAYDRFLTESGQKQLSDEWILARAMAGLTPVTGNGIQITLDDAQGTEPISSLTIIHDSDVQYVVDALRALGARAISINGERILGTSKLICNGPTILINRKFCPVPYVITAVGDAETMRTHFESDSLLSRRKSDGIRITMKTADSLTVPAYMDIQSIESQIDLLEVVGYEK